ncbi:Fe-S cluster assembly protein HesB [Sphaerisporangium sp. TRM90804]|uniref:Fe-S cluster assembly protein HesB n=1 Tax=Sphaerisporangium sp. TRM90804 TaxID=3031113 RepID=UPI00244BB391|nr:Fe-S cluster assembly protein HesB [Sphaerisporangium sp. TRM90804]MDH2426396.1 Fe-S cluster assembly protein HesB [Sphaerisporangium sp. TRM90804]
MNQENAVLTLTENAAKMVRDLTSNTVDPEHAGLRIAARSAQDHELVVSLSEGPHDADEVIEVRGARVFLDREAASSLGDKALDAVETESGGVSFHVA